MRIAVIGAGLAGLSAAYFLQKKGHSITLFEKDSIAAGASGIPVGFFHPYPGRNGKPSKFATEAMALTEELIAVAEQKLGRSVATREGILKCKWTPDEWEEGLEEREGGILIKRGMTVAIPEYLRGLFAAIDCEFVQKEIEKLSELQEFDCVVVAAGAGVMKLGLNLPIGLTKGQTLTLRTSKQFPYSTLDGGHVAHVSADVVQVGSTYEHDFKTFGPEIDVAKRELKGKLNHFFASENEYEFIGCNAGVRVCVKGSYLPIVKQIDHKTFVFTGLGSRGLLYHAYYGRLLADGLAPEARE